VRTSWEVTFAEYGGNDLEMYLAEGWVPFAVTYQDDARIVWLRRKLPKVPR